MSVRTRRKQPNPERFPRKSSRGMLRVCLMCRDAGQVCDVVDARKNETIQIWRPRTLVLVGEKRIAAPDSLTGKPVKTTLKLYMHDGRQTPCQLKFAAQSKEVVSSPAG